jgi:hypothetical protein
MWANVRKTARGTNEVEQQLLLGSVATMLRRESCRRSELVFRQRRGS